MWTACMQTIHRHNVMHCRGSCNACMPAYGLPQQCCGGSSCCMRGVKAIITAQQPYVLASATCGIVVCRPPVRPNISLGDTLAGLHAAFGAVMALLHRFGESVPQRQLLACMYSGLCAAATCLHVQWTVCARVCLACTCNVWHACLQGCLAALVPIAVWLSGPSGCVAH